MRLKKTDDAEKGERERRRSEREISFFLLLLFSCSAVF